jgi:hypothetical protein
VGGQVAGALGTGFAPSSTAVVGGVRNLDGNIEVTGQPVVRASAISAKRRQRVAALDDTSVATLWRNRESWVWRRQRHAKNHWCSRHSSVEVGGLALWRSSQLVDASSFSRAASRQVDTGGDGVLALRRQTRQPVVSTRAQSSFASSRSSVESSAPLDGNIRWQCSGEVFVPADPTGVTRFVGHTLNARREGMRGRQ